MMRSKFFLSHHRRAEPRVLSPSDSRVTALKTVRSYLKDHPLIKPAIISFWINESGWISPDGVSFRVSFGRYIDASFIYHYNGSLQLKHSLLEMREESHVPYS
jgi:hypothetical protein